MVKGTPEWKEKWFEICKADLTAHEGNPFIRDAKIIKYFCDKQGVDVGVGLDIYINEFYTDDEREFIDEEHIAQYKEVCRKYYLDFIVEVQKAMTLKVPFAE